MSDLAARIEITKLAHDLRRPVTELEFLATHPADELAELRTVVATALFTRHAGQAKLLAALSRKVPAVLSAKIAARALGPVVSARVAAALAPEEGAHLTGHFEATFLTSLARHLDPSRIAGIVGALPERLVVELGRRLVAEQEYVTLGRFVSAVPVGLALKVVEDAAGGEIFRIGMYVEDPTALDDVVRGLTDQQRAEIVAAAEKEGAWELLPPALT